MGCFLIAWRNGMTTAPNPQDDKELLELAAKAAKLINPRFHLATGEPYDAGTCILHDTHNASQTYSWNPLTDDGDALRLAVRLGLDLMRTDDDIEAIAGLPPHASMERNVPAPFAIEPLNGDPYAATRRAIVRAAASIARQESSHDR